jgi:hypothetical protein
MSLGDFLANAKHRNNVRNFDPIVADLNKRFPRRREIPMSPTKGAILFVILAALIVILLIACSGHAQTISPAISECKGPRCKGEFTVTNDQIVPLALWIEAQSVVSSPSGTIFYHHLSPDVQVKLTNTSARLAPKQSYVIGYDVTCPGQCVINFAATFTGLHSNGLLLALHLSNVVYICEKSKHCRDDIRSSWHLK